MNGVLYVLGRDEQEYRVVITKIVGDRNDLIDGNILIDIMSDNNLIENKPCDINISGIDKGDNFKITYELIDEPKYQNELESIKRKAYTYKEIRTIEGSKVLDILYAKVEKGEKYKIMVLDKESNLIRGFHISYAGGMSVVTEGAQSSIGLEIGQLSTVIKVIVENIYGWDMLGALARLENKVIELQKDK